MKNKTFTTLNIVTSAMLSAFAVILGTTFHALTQSPISSLFSPMHFPVLLAGILCGQWLGLICGALTPLISFMSSGGVRPPFPTGLIPMIFELAVYGFLSGLLRRIFLKNPKTNKVYSVLALAISMIAGRLINAFVAAVILALSGGNFFVSLGERLLSNFTSTWAGIIVQLVFIPLILFALQKSGVLIKYIPDDIQYAVSERNETEEEAKNGEQSEK
ncbi:MAG: ECF transporter S component [Corallococcus sp.]|nr:ECF transporter S component [Bacillota bacterium]MCM1533235.1 ECF transporter S component [Corallococcus sp.]